MTTLTNSISSKNNITVIVAGFGSAGDVHPMAGIALTLKRRGYRVIFTASNYFRTLAERIGLEFYPVITEEEYLAAINNPDLWHPFRGLRVLAQHLILPYMRPFYLLITSQASKDKILVIAPASGFGARIAQEKPGIPLVTVHLQPLMLRSAIEPGCFGFPDILHTLPKPLRKLYLRTADRLIIDPLMANETNSFRSELGLPPVRRFFDQWIHSPLLTIGLFPEWFAPPQPDWPENVHLTGFPLWDERDLRQLDPELEKFLSAGDPPVLFTYGSAMTQGRNFFRVSADVCSKGGFRGLFLTQFPDQLPSSMPDSIQHFDYAPFSAVLPKVSAVVHHGGIGTTSQAIAAGIPQLIIPLAHDQPDNAVRVRRLGLGDYLLPKAYKTNKVIIKLKRLINSIEINDACKIRADAVSEMKALEQSCDLIEHAALVKNLPGPAFDKNNI